MTSHIENLALDAELLDLLAGLGSTSGNCPYLEGRDARWYFLEGALVGRRYRQLMDQGYRRHGKLLYRMECQACQECQIIRIPVAGFAPSQSQKRVWRRGHALGLITCFVRPEVSSLKLDLYRRYLAYQHGKTEELDEQSYADFFAHSFLESTQELQLWHKERLIGVGTVDILEDAISSVYFYFDPDYKDYSPGTYSMLAELEHARAGACLALCGLLHCRLRSDELQIALWSKPD
jgi:arginine-tRNA-protein transferase